MKILKVTEKYNNKKLINFLQNNFSNLKTSTIYKTLRKKDIKINDKRISENCVLKTGDELKIYIADDLLFSQKDIPIIYEDENIVVFDKPIDIEVTGENSLTSYAQKRYGAKANPCHRLDRNTSGLVLFAKNNNSLNELLNAFKNHAIEKHYICLVVGIPHKDSEKLEAYLFKDSKKSLVYISKKQMPGYQKIITHYKVIKKNSDKNISLLDVQLETGKTHQIRAHLAYIGHPIIGDGKYGLNKINKDFKQKTQLLSSYSLSFNLDPTCELSYLNKITIKQKKLPFSNLI